MQATQLILILSTILTIATAQVVQTYTYKTVGDLNITLDVHFPQKSSYEKYPLVIGLHGGAYYQGSKKDAFSTPELNEIHALGFAAVNVDYRLAPGVLLPDIVQDVQDAYNWLRTELVKNATINPDLIVVMGRSAGGGLAVISGYMLSPPPKAILAFYPGCTNFTIPMIYNPATPVTEELVVAANLLRTPVLDEYESSNKYDARNILFGLALIEGKSGWLLVSKDPKEPTDQVMAALKNYSAVDNVTPSYPPTYLLHGLNDTVVPYEQSVELSSVLNATGVTNVLDLVPGVGHGFDQGVNSSSPIWHDHILPAFDFAQSMIQLAIQVEELIM